MFAEQNILPLTNVSRNIPDKQQNNHQLISIWLSTCIYKNKKFRLAISWSTRL